MALISLPKRLASRFYEYLREAVWYARHLVRGTSYAEYYADRMNRIVTRNPDWGLNLNRRFQLEYLRAREFSNNYGYCVNPFLGTPLRYGNE